MNITKTPLFPQNGEDHCFCRRFHFPVIDFEVSRDRACRSKLVIPPHAPGSSTTGAACIPCECFGHSWRTVCVCFPSPVRSTAWFTQGILPLISAGYLRACLPSTWHHSQPRLGRCSGVLEGANEQRDGVSTKPYFGFLNYNCMHIPLADVRPAVNMVSILSLFSFWLLLFRNS